MKIVISFIFLKLVALSKFADAHTCLCNSDGTIRKSTCRKNTERATCTGFNFCQSTCRGPGHTQCDCPVVNGQCSNGCTNAACEGLNPDAFCQSGGIIVQQCTCNAVSGASDTEVTSPVNEFDYTIQMEVSSGAVHLMTHRGSDIAIVRGFHDDAAGDAFDVAWATMSHIDVQAGNAYFSWNVPIYVSYQRTEEVENGEIVYISNPSNALTLGDGAAWDGEKFRYFASDDSGEYTFQYEPTSARVLVLSADQPDSEGPVAFYASSTDIASATVTGYVPETVKIVSGYSLEPGAFIGDVTEFIFEFTFDGSTYKELCLYSVNQALVMSESPCPPSDNFVEDKVQTEDEIEIE